MATVEAFEAHYAHLQEEEWELLQSAQLAIKGVVDPMNSIIHFCIVLSLAAQNINSGTFRGLIVAILVVELLMLWIPFASALQMLQELKPQFHNLDRRQRELLMKSNNYKNDCTNDYLIYRLDSLASSMKPSIDLASGLGRLYLYRVLGLMLLAVVLVFVTFFGCIFLSNAA